MGQTAGRSVLHYRLPAWGSHDYIELINTEEYCVELWVVDSLNHKFDFMYTNCAWISCLKCEFKFIYQAISDIIFFYNVIVC